MYYKVKKMKHTKIKNRPKKRKNWHYRIISFLASSSGIVYVRIVPIKEFRGRFKVLTDFNNIIEDLRVNGYVISAYAHNRIMHIKRNIHMIPEFYYINEQQDDLEVYKDIRKYINKKYKMKSYKIKIK